MPPTDDIYADDPAGPDHRADPAEQYVPEPPITGPQKAWAGFSIALVGSGVTAALPLFTEPPTSSVLAIGSAVLTAAAAGLGVYQTTNRPRS